MWLRWWRAWWHRGSMAHVQFVMYSRAACPLCDEAWHELTVAQRRWRFTLEKVDIEGNADLEDLYGHSIPVVLVNGKERFRGKVNRVLLERLLVAECTKNKIKE